MLRRDDALVTPPIDDRKLYDVIATKHALPSLVVAVEIGLFELLAKRPRTTDEIAEELNIQPRAAAAIVCVVASLGFLSSHEDDCFRLTQVAQTYLLADSEYYRAGLERYDSPELHQLRRAIRAHDPVQPFAVKMGDLPDEEIESFIATMHAMTVPAASSLSEQPVFDRINRLLDVGGGSGSLCMAIATRRSDIRCTIMDLAPVCKIAQKNTKAHGLQRQIETLTGDMFQDPWPGDFDGVLFGNIFHDWDLKSCRFLARQAFDALEPGGVICLHEMLLNERRDGPLTVACFSITMLLHEKGKQFTADELEDLLSGAGFNDFQVTPTFGYYSLVTATKDE